MLVYLILCSYFCHIFIYPSKGYDGPWQKLQLSTDTWKLRAPAEDASGPSSRRSSRGKNLLEPHSRPRIALLPEALGAAGR